jgi:hypothetical protein
MEEKKEVKLKKDKGCILCQHLIDCKGKPENVKLCINFKERIFKD